jgi:hypothetical protein
VFVVELATGGATNLDGRYRIEPVPAGVYTLRVSYSGFETQVITGVEVRAGQATEINVVLSTGSLGEVVVVAEEIVQANNQVGLDRLRARSAAVSDAISADVIARSGSSSAADAMERVTGASVQGGRYVYVRGLGDRYAATQLNGATLPTADPDRRAVQFDLFPSGFVDNIVTLKTFTPDRPGSFSGGLVDITTRSFPESFSASVSVSSGFNSRVAPGGSVLLDPAARVSMLGTATRLEIPAELRDPGFELPMLNTTEVFNPDTSPERLEAIALNERLTDVFLSRGVAPREAPAEPNVGLSASVGNRVSLFGRDLGFVASLTLDSGVGAYSNGIVGRYDTAGDGGAPRQRQIRTDQRATSESSVGALGALSYRLSARDELSLTTLLTRNAESQARIISGPAPIPIGAAGDPITVTDRVTGHIERQLLSGQLRGRHEIGRGLRADWRGSLARTTLDEPDLRFFANANREGQLLIGGASLSNTLHFFRASTEDLGGLALDLTTSPRTFGGLPLQVKVGGLVERTARDFRERRFEIRSEGLALAGEDRDAVEAFYSPANSGVVEVRAPNPFDPQQRSTYVIGHRLLDNTQPNNQYDGSLDVRAGYAMAELPLLRGVRVIAGARVEQTDLQIAVVDRAGVPVDPDDAARSGRIEKVDVLPSLNVVVALSGRMNLRAAATQTIARPTFREIAPFESFDFATDGPLLGNPGLERTLITNLDLRWEWFNQPGSILAVSGYAKRLSQPIERVITDIENNVSQFLNVDEATILGVEAEVRQALAVLPVLDRPWLRNVSVGGNLTLTRSEITIAPEELAERRFINPDAAPTRALQGQSPYLVNLDLSYENRATASAAGLYFNVFGRRLSRVGVPDVFESPSPQLDLVASQQFLGQVTVKATVRNLLGSNQREGYDFPSSTWGAIGGQEPIYQAYDLGRTVSLGLSLQPRVGSRSSVPPVGAPASAPAPR